MEIRTASSSPFSYKSFAYSVPGYSGTCVRLCSIYEQLSPVVGSWKESSKRTLLHLFKTHTRSQFHECYHLPFLHPGILHLS